MAKPDRSSFLVIALATLAVVGSGWLFSMFRTTSTRHPLGRAEGPDVLIAEIHEARSYGSVAGIAAYSIGTISCNVGDEHVAWDRWSDRHPVIAQNLYRIDEGRFEQIGASWVKHAYRAAHGSYCSPCRGGTNDRYLGPGCSDPYSATVNGRQSALGPRSGVDPTSGALVFPTSPPPIAPARRAIARRLQAAESDVDPARHPHARYFVEAQIVAADDSGAGNAANNRSYREVTFRRADGRIVMDLPSSAATIAGAGALEAWDEIDPSVRLFTLPCPGGGTIRIGLRTGAGKDGWRHTNLFAQNGDERRAVRAVRIETAAGDLRDASVSGGTPGVRQPQARWEARLDAEGVTWDAPRSTPEDGSHAGISWGTGLRFSIEHAALRPMRIEVELEGSPRERMKLDLRSPKGPA